jgi:hypothetical protein
MRRVAVIAANVRNNEEASGGPARPAALVGPA